MSAWLHSILTAIEEWLLDYGVWGLILVSFTESSFFPIIPDVVLIPLALANPDSALLYALYTTLASAFGAILGWFIGKKLGRPILQRFVSEKVIVKVEEYFEKYGSLSILIAGFTPIPYKVFTVFSGVSNMRISTLFFWSLLGRGIRFFLEAALIITLGEQAWPFIENNFTIVTVTVAVVIIIGFVIYRSILKRRSIV
ncbi:YqaA family protein [Bacillus spongiae]|uniref:YqaA family protein n=1 Tax=Bacillus spongiae TaxID=2683610 RepID=A0ABU8HJX1_9BACI